MPLDLSTLETMGMRDQRAPCKVAEALATLKPADRKVIAEGIAHDVDAIRRGARAWLAERGLTVSTASIGSHRAGVCKCGPRG